MGVWVVTAHEKLIGAGKINGKLDRLVRVRKGTHIHAAQRQTRWFRQLRTALGVAGKARSIRSVRKGSVPPLRQHKC